MTRFAFLLLAAPAVAAPEVWYSPLPKAAPVVSRLDYLLDLLAPVTYPDGRVGQSTLRALFATGSPVDLTNDFRVQHRITDADVAALQAYRVATERPKVVAPVYYLPVTQPANLPVYCPPGAPT